MPATDAGAAVQLNALRNAITHVAAYNGTTETSSARMPYSFPAAATKSINQTADADLPMPNAATANTLRFFTALTGGTEMYYIDLGATSSNPTPGADWTLRVDSAQINITP